MMAVPAEATAGLVQAEVLPAAEMVAWLDAIAEISRAAVTLSPDAELLDLIAGTTARLTGQDFCAVMIVDPTRAILLIKGSYGLSREYVDAIDASNPIPVGASDAGEGPSSRAFRSQRPTAIADIALDAPSRSWETLATREGFRSLLSVPLVVGDARVGVLNCYSAARHEFSAREIVLMESIANQAGLAIDIAQRRTADTARLRQLAEEAGSLRAQVDSLRKAAADHDELLRSVLHGGGLDAVVTSLARMLRCIIVVDDTNGRIIASAGARPPEVAALHKVNRTRLAVEEVQPDESDIVVLQTPRSSEHPGLLAPVAINDEVTGHVWALQPAGALGDLERQAIARGAAVVGLALLEQRTAQEVEWRLSRDFLDDLLDSEGQATDALLARAAQLGADLRQPHTMFVIRRDSNSDDTDRSAREQRSLLSLVQRLVAEREAPSLVATRSDHAVVLLSEWQGSPSAQIFAETLRREIHAYADGWSATASIGPRCADISEYGDAYRLTCSVLDMVQQAGGRDRIVSLDGAGIYRLLLQVKRPRELKLFAEATLGAVCEYDRKRQGPLVATLRRYLARRCDVAATARDLRVHPNTVAYRLRRIESLLGVELNDPQTMLEIQMAVMIQDILGDS